jgi:hypothetical protein
MKIEIINGTYTRDEEAAKLLTNTEDEYVAALAQKLIIRQERAKRLNRNRSRNARNV